MMYKIRLIGDPVLREKTKQVTNFDGQLQKTVAQMIDFMHQEDGIGLAAPQVGLRNSILVVDISPIEEEEKPRAFINPKIISAEGESVVEEGCLSIPGVREDVTRPERIRLAYQDLDGRRIEEDYDGWLARVLQHELDHLNGILFVDLISPVKRQLLINQGLIPEKY
ncbi:MAG TPA: peptide deformylase [Caldithrix abyssi]|uniref:Peptide deformylase n=1 Tax=Caldithrix abyssi TaxID=187145 RepID=A0A7V4U3Q3_CALAY|nr:peptide deformylase [Caldithrix abyssi]